MKERLKSIPLWTAVLSLIYLVINGIFEINIPNWAEISATIITILTVLFGIANNPTDRSSF